MGGSRKFQCGEITVFLSLIMTCICALMCGLLESARAAGSGWYLQNALDSAVDSVMSQYHREVWENYRLLLLEFETSAQLEEELKPYLDAYLEADSSYLLSPERLSVGEPERVTDQQGRLLEREITDYMKLGIWTVERDPAILKEAAADLKEAAGLSEIIKHCRIDTGKTVRLEEALEQIGASLKKQGQYYGSGRVKLGRCNGRGFISDANKLSRELKRMPGLIAKYESAADALGRELDASRAAAKEQKGELKEGTWGQISAETECYRTYTDQEGERRKQVLSIGEKAGGNLTVVEAAIREAEETLEYISEWEPDDEDDELDEEPLWNAVLRTFGRFQTDTSFGEPGIRDKKKMNLLESIGNLASGDLLRLVIPEEMEVSEAAADWTGYPSRASGIDSGGPQGESKEGEEKSWEEKAAFSLVDTALINEYAAHFFVNALWETDRESGPLKYEQEYLIVGESSDRQNLQGTVYRLLAVREAMNLLYLLSDSEKRGEAFRLASAILGAASLTPLTAVVGFFILTVWAFAEGIEDLRALFRGGRIPFVKSRESWKLTLEQMMSAERPGSWSSQGGSEEREGEGLSYQDYLKLFLLIQNRQQKDYRMMDLIQLNIAEKQNGFRMAYCACRVEAQCRARGRRVTVTRKAFKAYSVPEP